MKLMPSTLSSGRGASRYGVGNLSVVINPPKTTPVVIAGGSQGSSGASGLSAYQIAVGKGFLGTQDEWLASLKGADGDKGPAGDASAVAIVNFAEAAGQVLDQDGVFMLVPVSNVDPDTETLSQQASVTIPYSGGGDLKVALYATSSLTGVKLTLGTSGTGGSTNPGDGGTNPGDGGGSTDPVEPTNPNTPVDLSGDSTIYGQPGTIFKLGIDLAGSTAAFTLKVPSDLKIQLAHYTEVIKPAQAAWATSTLASSYAPSGEGLGSSFTLKTQKFGSGDFSITENRLRLSSGCRLGSSALGLSFNSTTNPDTTQAPPSIRMGFKGVVPAGTVFATLAEMYDYGVGRFTLSPSWQGNVLSATVQRGDTVVSILSDSDDRRILGTLQLYEVEYVDDTSGPGGVINFYVDGEKMGESKPVDFKLRISPATPIEVNSSLGNVTNSIEGLEVEYISLTYGRPDEVATYEDVTSGEIAASDLVNLVVNATEITQPRTEPSVLEYSPVADSSQVTSLSITVGDMVVPTGSAYKAVLEDWSTGVGVAHPNELVMTKVSAQNVHFEDAQLFAAQPAWTEVLPQGPVPTIKGINFYCEGIRIGNYVQFQFGYDWSPTELPTVPFGNTSGHDSYMVPHKWLIYDQAGTLLARVEQIDGKPLNSLDHKAVWEGSYDGRGVAIITEDNHWFPSGTCRSGLIWRSHDPVPYTQAQIWDHVPTFELSVPFASQINGSVNGFDFRLYQGGNSSDGQSNGFANSRWMSWDQTTYADIQVTVRNTENPWKAGIEPVGILPNSGLWLKYTPFTQSGRTPVTGPGGTRDDRQIMPEMVARFARDVTGVRPHGNLPYADIALSYLTAYVSDPYHCFENGRNVPLFKGATRRAITARNHYYGAGELTTPESAAYYVQGGRISEWVAGSYPLRVYVPTGGVTADRPVFGGNQIDHAHAHQFPHWGSMLYKSPEFAFLGHKFTDQYRLYGNSIIYDIYGGRICTRDAAWGFMHAALMWKTASRTSPRLYTRAEVLDWVVFDFEAYYDAHYAGFMNPPRPFGVNNYTEILYNVMPLFGPMDYNDTNGANHSTFQLGYWMSALHAAHHLGFLDALRAASTKAATMLDFLIDLHAKYIVGRVNDASLLNVTNGVDYATTVWTNAELVASGGDITKLPQTWAEVTARRRASEGADSPQTWDVLTYREGGVLITGPRDGQSMDHVLAGPTLMKEIIGDYPGLDQAIQTTLARRQEKIDSETARGATEAGTKWFRFHQITNNIPFTPPQTA